MAPNLKNKMLHRSFNPAKCKMALKLAVARIKLMKNKKEALFKQQKREVAQLLESGQEQTARIRVEHVVREEKTMAAFELIEIYCELIVARLAIIESQKNCPIDLKEAITSVIFASPRCADIPELSDIQKHLTAKYGKEFTSAAIELRPDCGVSRMLVEKLSAKAPDGPTKMKILSAIAEEHNITWDAKSFGEDRKLSEDLLNGPNTFENTSKIHVELPNLQTPPRHDQRNDAPVNLHEHNRNSSLNSQTYAPTDVPESRPSRSEGMELRHSSSGDGNDFHVGRQNWNMEFKDATSAAQAAAESAERASMAARAAAELSSQGKITRQYSNESQKSYASGLREEGREYYTGSKVHGGHFAKNSVDNSFHDTKTRINNVIEENARAGAAETSRSHSRKSNRSASPKSSTSFSDDDTLINDVQLDGYSKQSPSEVAGLKTSGGDRVMKQQSSRSKLELPNEGRGGVKTGNIDSYGEERFRKQSSSASSISHSSSGEGHDFVSNSSHQKIADENPFAFMDQDRIQTDTKLTHSSDNAAVVFDDSGSEDDFSKYIFGGDYDRYESAFFTSPDRKSPTPSYFSADTITAVTGKNMSKAPGMSVSQSHLFTEPPEFSGGLTRSEVPSQINDSVPVTFDHSAGPSSESEEELDKFKLSGTIKQNIYSGNPEPDQSESPWLAQSSFAEKVNSGSNGKQRLKASSDDLGFVETNHHQNQETEYNVEGQNRSNFGVPPTQKMSSRLTKSQMDSSDIDHKSPYSASDKEKPRQYSEFSSNKNDYPAETPTAMKDDNRSSSDVEKELKFGMLTGGIRNKRNQRPPYIRKPSIDASSKNSGEKTSTSESSMTSGAYNQKVSTKGDKKSSSKTQVTYDSDSDDSDEKHASSKHSGEKTFTSESSMTSGAYNQKVSTKGDKKSSSKTQVAYDSDSDDSDEELTQQTFRREPSSQRSGAKVGDKTGSRMHHTYFDFDDGDSEEDSSRQNITSKGHLGSSALSRRTRASPSQSGKTSYLKPKLTPEVSVTLDHSAERSSSRSSYAIETRTTQSQTVSSSDYGSSEQASSNKQATPKTRPEYKNSQREESLKASAVEQPSSLQSKIAASGSTESLKPSSSSGNAPSRENSLKKASHVHPKLPDYDDFAAHFQSLRSNRK